MSDNKTVIVKQIRSAIRRDKLQSFNLLGLGLNKIGCTRILKNTPSTIGMINKVKHLIRVKYT